MGGITGVVATVADTAGARAMTIGEVVVVVVGEEEGGTTTIVATITGASLIRLRGMAVVAGTMTGTERGIGGGIDDAGVQNVWRGVKQEPG